MREKHRNMKNLSLQINNQLSDYTSPMKITSPYSGRKLSISIPATGGQQQMRDFDANCSSPSIYSDGPAEICSNVFLYSEPTRYEATQFDVVINVAKEVANPFEAIPVEQAGLSEAASELATSDITSNSTSCSDFSASSDTSPCSPYSSNSMTSSCSPSSSVEERCFWDGQHSKQPSFLSSRQASSCRSNTSSQTDQTEQPLPEYIFVPWDHNSTLLQDLPRLTNLIDQRVREGKRVLVHCQCGISRSASLVLAYVMQNKNWDLNTAYAYVKEKSPCISPNMTLMFQLMEWYSTFNTTPSASSTRFEDARTVVALQ